MLKRLFQLSVLTGLVVFTLFGCASSSPTSDTYVSVADNEWSLLSDDGTKLSPFASSYARAAAPKLMYKEFVFQPQVERQRMQKKIQALNLGGLLAHVESSNPYLMLLRDGRVLASGGTFKIHGLDQPVSTLAIVDPKSNTVTKLAGLRVPRVDDAVLQLADDRVIFIGGETTKGFADEGTDNLTNTVEELNLQSGKSRVIGRITVPRHGVIAESVGERDILVVGGWNERRIARDERWWPGAEILRVAPKEKND